MICPGRLANDMHGSCNHTKEQQSEWCLILARHFAYDQVLLNAGEDCSGKVRLGIAGDNTSASRWYLSLNIKDGEWSPSKIRIYPPRGATLIWSAGNCRCAIFDANQAFMSVVGRLLVTWSRYDW
jgi:hypothetical protein